MEGSGRGVGVGWRGAGEGSGLFRRPPGRAEGSGGRPLRTFLPWLRMDVSPGPLRRLSPAEPRPGHPAPSLVVGGALPFGSAARGWGDAAQREAWHISLGCRCRPGLGPASPSTGRRACGCAGTAGSGGTQPGSGAALPRLSAGAGGVGEAGPPGALCLRAELWGRRPLGDVDTSGTGRGKMPREQETSPAPIPPGHR